MRYTLRLLIWRTLTVTCGTFTNGLSFWTNRSCSWIGVKPTTFNSLTSGTVIFPSGRTTTIPESSGSLHTVIASTSRSPMTYSVEGNETALFAFAFASSGFRGGVASGIRTLAMAGGASCLLGRLTVCAGGCVCGTAALVSDALVSAEGSAGRLALPASLVDGVTPDSAGAERVAVLLPGCVEPFAAG